jgi:hypothetical protein
MRIRSITGLVFSPTGGCLKIARSLRESLDAYQVEIHNITKPAVREQLVEIPKTADYLFVIFPVYADTLPDIVAEYLGRLRVSGIPVTIIASTRETRWSTPGPSSRPKETPCVRRVRS